MLMLVCQGVGTGIEMWASMSFGPGAWGGMFWTWSPWVNFSEIPRYVLLAFRLALISVEPVLIMAWCVFSLVALLIFRQSMGRAKVRNAHVVRAWAYSVFPVLPLAATAVYAYGTASAVLYAWGFHLPADGFTAFIFAAIAFVLWSLRCAYKLYLRIPHAFWVAVSSQAIAILAALAAITIPNLFFR